MNDDNIKAMADRVDQAADAQADASAHQAFLNAQLKASELARDMAVMIHEKHPGTHPAIVTNALLNSVASLVALFSQGNVVKAVGTLSTLQDQLRATTLRLMDIAKKDKQAADAPKSQAH